MQNIKTIAFAGDSFCGSPGKGTTKVSYINLLEKHTGAEIVHVGHPGSSIWDLALVQLPSIFGVRSLLDFPTYKQKYIKIPDVLICCWTDKYRVYHPLVREINAGSISEKTHAIHKDYYLYEAAKLFYSQLCFLDKQELEYVSLLNYIDNEIFRLIKDRCKIINLWSFSKDHAPKGTDHKDLQYLYRWKTGVEVRPALVWFSRYNTEVDIGVNDLRANHLEDEKNKMMADWLINILENHQNGDLFDYASLIENKGENL